MDSDLVGPQYGFSSKGQIQLEQKADMKSRGLASPDLGDTLAMSFAVSVKAKKKPQQSQLIYSFPDRAGLGWMGR